MLETELVAAVVAVLVQLAIMELVLLLEMVV